MRLVPKTAPDAKQALVERVKQLPKREPGSVQCNRCGSRTMMTTVNGSWIDQDGKYHRGTVCDDRVCYDCHLQGIVSFMLPSLPKLAKEAKPRRTKPKAVK